MSSARYIVNVGQGVKGKGIGMGMREIRMVKFQEGQRQSNERDTLREGAFSGLSRNLEPAELPEIHKDVHS